VIERRPVPRSSSKSRHTIRVLPATQGLAWPAMGTVLAVMPTLSRPTPLCGQTVRKRPRSSARSPLGGVRPQEPAFQPSRVRASGNPRPARSGPWVNPPCPFGPVGPSSAKPAADSRRAWHRYRGRSLSVKGDRLPPCRRQALAELWPEGRRGQTSRPVAFPPEDPCAGPFALLPGCGAPFAYPYDPRTAERLIRFPGLLELAGKHDQPHRGHPGAAQNRHPSRAQLSSLSTAFMHRHDLGADCVA
jgi:hypothetical protein